MLKRLHKTVGGLPISLSLDLFDKLVVPILLYGSEIWSFTCRGSIERVQNKFCKYLLSVSYNTSNAAVLGDLGRKPLSVMYNYKCVKFWLNIVQDNNVRLRNSLYYMLKQFDDAGSHTWASDVRILLCSLGFGDVWLNHGVGNVNQFLYALKERLQDTAFQSWHSDVTHNSKLFLYKQFKLSLEIESYLSVNMYWKYRVSLSRFRCVNHKLAIERFRAERYDRNLRVCKYCSNNGRNCIKEEIHVLLVCPLYNDIRNRFLRLYIREFVPLDITFTHIMSSKNHNCIKDLALFTFHMFKIHNQYTFNVIQ